jgi:pyruvate/2-oxoglutarate dehydrogenase complex dihydrolipoamide dehydrogenase (E3) component
MQSLRRTVRLRAAPEPSRVKFLMLMNESYDLIVIGSGPAGEKGAAQAAYFDKRVVLVEKDTHLGGAGVNTGAVPSNTLLIATGSVPNWPEGIPRDPRLYDSDSILRMESLPRSLVVVGSGVIGCEYASMFRALGIEVKLLGGSDRLLPFLDKVDANYQTAVPHIYAAGDVIGFPALAARWRRSSCTWARAACTSEGRSTTSCSPSTTTRRSGKPTSTRRTTVCRTVRAARGPE